MASNQIKEKNALTQKITILSPPEITSECFWCDLKLIKTNKRCTNAKTKDHLFSKYIRKIYCNDIINPYLTCPACRDCNSRRGRISDIFELIHRFGENNWENWAKGQIPNKVNFRKRLKKYLRIEKDFLNKVKKIIEDSMFEEHVKSICLLEINEIFNY